MGSTAPSPPPNTLLGRFLRVTLVDGRVLVGRLYCLDWKQNLVLRGAELWRPAPELLAEAPLDSLKRHLGLVAVEARHVAKYEVRTGGGAGVPEVA